MEQYQMSDYRIVYNEQTGRYRIDRRGWLGWSFVMSPSGDDYASFDSYHEACRFACKLQVQGMDRHRRWKIIGPCRQACA